MVDKRQILQQVSILHRQLHHKNFKYLMLKIRLQQIQNLANTNQSILEHQDYIVTHKESKTTTTKVLKYLGDKNITIIQTHKTIGQSN